MGTVYLITHPEVEIDPEIPVPEWQLSDKGIQRICLLVAKDWVQSIKSIYCSKERKAMDGAELLARNLGLSYSSFEALGENDRSSTGYLAKHAFEAMADKFFANPEESANGWERAVDAQSRIVQAVDSIITEDSSGGDIAIVSHGGVGALLLCHLSNKPINRSMDQPGRGGGNLFCFEKDSGRLIHGWKSIEES